ncbi:Zinc finger CCCH domain-containing protein [Melia azedarach]|uniref:Zinc finger CCCH domain-containing protein n=1 Tax=Melia azedarach TaxID=155640 RepID=A0ACC1WX73_MELAZ|nr:Zinc finger CCCH domain-containing protein [Melia azedarach]
MAVINTAAAHQFYNRGPPKKNSVCVFWLKGRCNRNPCRYLHVESPTVKINRPTTTRPTQDFNDPKKTHTQIRVCDDWISDSCVYGDKCRFLHSWVHSDDDNNYQNLSILTRLNGHKKDVMGIGLPSGSNKLYSGAKDGTVRVWDCESGECVKIINNRAEIGCLISEGSWVFLGFPNVVKALKIDAATGDYETFVLKGPVGQVNSMAVCNINDVLFAGSEDGVISVWKGSFEANPFKLVASIKAHSGSVLSLAVGTRKKKLFSSCADGTIRYLFSCSLDKTIKIWIANQDGNFEVTYTHEEQYGVVSLFGMLDAEGKPMLLTSCKDSGIRVYELPSFKERLRMFSRREVETIEMGPHGLLFLGDRTGVISVWKWLPDQKMESDS